MASWAAEDMTADALMGGFKALEAELVQYQRNGRIEKWAMAEAQKHTRWGTAKRERGGWEQWTLLAMIWGR
jgi:hypothetical protein